MPSSKDVSPPAGVLTGGGKEELRASFVKPYVLRLRHEKGADAVTEMLTRAGLPANVVENETSWISAQTAERILRAVQRGLGSDALLQCGDWMVTPENLGAYVRLLRSASGPAEAYRLFCDNSQEMTRAGTYRFQRLGPRKVRITYLAVDEDVPAELPSLLQRAREAELLALPRLWGFAPARNLQPVGAKASDENEIYVLTWTSLSPWWFVSIATLMGAVTLSLFWTLILADGHWQGVVPVAVLGCGLGAAMGGLMYRAAEDRRSRLVEKHRIDALERSLTLRGDVDMVPTVPGELNGAVLGGKYRILKKIGSGGIGVVYSAEHVSLGNKVAVKVLRGAAARDASEIARLRREAQVQGSIHHPNVVQTLDLDQLADGSIYVVMEILYGSPLSEKLHQQGAIAPGFAVPVFIQVCRALTAAHAQGVVHRDLKPGNIFLCDGGVAKVLDFGMSKLQTAESLTQEGYTLGTPEYMAPEQCIGGAVEARTDLYAFGVLMYEALTGELPIQAENRRDLLDLHQRQPPKPMRDLRPELALPPALDEAVMKCLNKRVVDRPRDAAALETLLAAVSLDGLPLDYAPHRWGDTSAAGRRRRGSLL